MTEYEFTVVLALREAGDETTSLAERLSESGCDDAVCLSRDGQVSLAFGRESESLEAAIRSALDDIAAAGVPVSEVVLNEDEIRSWRTA
jgi:hypothetical protein